MFDNNSLYNELGFHWYSIVAGHTKSNHQVSKVLFGKLCSHDSQKFQAPLESRVEGADTGLGELILKTGGSSRSTQEIAMKLSIQRGVVWKSCTAKSH